MINGDTYNEKEAVLGYVASMKNKTDLMSGDHSYFTPPFDGKLCKYAHKLEEEKRYFDNASFPEPYYKKLAGESVINATSVYYNALWEAVKKYIPEIVPELQNNLSSYTSSYVIDEKKEANNIEYYLSTLEYQHDVTSGNFDNIPKSLEKKYKEWQKIADQYQQSHQNLGKRESDNLGTKVIMSRNSFFNALKEKYEEYRTQRNGIDSDAMDTLMNKENDGIIGKVKNTVSSLIQKDNKSVQVSPSLFYTVNGDMVSDAKIEKISGEWIFNVKINNRQFLERVEKNDLKEARKTLKENPLELVNRYFPKEVMKKIAAEEFMLPRLIDVGTGKKEILHRFNIDTVMDQNSPYYGEKIISIRIGNKNIDMTASQEDISDYYNRLISVNDLVSKNIGNRLVESAKTTKLINDKENSIGSDKKSNIMDEQTKQPEKKQPQLITVNGDSVSHAHVFKSNKSDDWFFTAKINGVPLKPQKVSNEDMEAVVVNKSKKPHELMETYYPTKMMAKISSEEFKKPFSVNTTDGEKPVYKFNVYKVEDKNNLYYGKYRFYAQVGDLKMSENASKKDLDAYFDRVVTPADLVKKVFGERLHLQEYYKMFTLPENANIAAKDIRIMKNAVTNKYEISVNLGDHGRTSAKEISYDDRQSYFSHKTASKEQLAAKYLGPEISDMLKSVPKQEREKQYSMNR